MNLPPLKKHNSSRNRFRQLLPKICDPYHGAFVSFDSKNPPRAAKVFVPLDELNVDPELVFGRLNYHLEPTDGAPNGKPGGNAPAESQAWTHR